MKPKKHDGIFSLRFLTQELAWNSFMGGDTLASFVTSLSGGRHVVTFPSEMSKSE